MPIDDEQLKADYDAYTAYRDDTAEWRASRDKCDAFVSGAQYSTTGRDEINARGQEDIVINRIRPLLITRISAMVANKPTGTIYGTRKEDVELATTLNDFIDWHWYKSLGQVVMDRVVSYQQKHGIGWFVLYSANMEDFGRGELRIGDLKYRNVFVDKAAGAHPLFDDAPVIIVSKLRRPMDFLNELPKKIRDQIPEDISIYHPNDEINWETQDVHGKDFEIGMPRSVTIAYTEKEKAAWIRVFDVYRRKHVEMRGLRQKITGKIYKILGEDDEPTQEDKILMQRNIGEAQLMQMGIPPQQVELFRLEEVTIPVPRIEYYQQLSGKFEVPESYEILPISHYPVVPVVGDDMGNAMPYGEVDYMIGQQEMLNASVGLTLLNAALASNWRVLGDFAKAGITDVKKFQRDFSIPGSWHNIKTDPLTGKFPIEILRPDPLPQAWFTLMQYFSQSMEFQMSTFSFRTGDPSKAPETAFATQQLGQWANDVLRLPLSRLEIAIERLFDNLLEWMPSYYTFYKQFEILGIDGTMSQREINSPRWNESAGAWETINDLSSIKANYRIRLGSTLPSQTVFELQVMQQLAQAQPALLMNVIDRMPGIRKAEKDEIRQTLDQVFQLSQANSQKEQVIQAMQKQMNSMQEMIAAMQREKAVAKVEPMIAEWVADMRHMRDEMQKNVRKSQRNGKRK